MRYLTLLLLLHAAPSAAASPRRVHPESGLVISSIVIETHSVFDTDTPAENKLIYRAANKIHIKTFDLVVERELLFEVGDKYDPLLIEETERNLRALGFIRRAEISASVNAKGGMDLIVRTYDSWTLEVVSSYKRAGGATNIKAGLAEHNILGQGKSGSAVYSNDGGVGSEAISYKDPQVLNYKRLQYAVTASAVPGSRIFLMSLNRPFYASIARTSAGGSVGYTESRLADQTRRTGEAGVNYGVALATSTERTRRVTFGLLTRRAVTSGPLTNLEQLTFLKVGGDWQELDFLTVRRIQNFTRDEDYNLGLGVFPAVAWAPKVIGTTQAQIIPSILATKGFTWSNQLVLLKSGYASKYVNGHNGNRLATFDATYFLRQFRFQTLAFHTGLDLGWNLDASNQLGLGEVNGLRGYGLSEFAGTRRFLFNIEDRIYVYDDLFKIMDVGTVLFYDSGYAWPASRSVKLSDLKSSVGMGLRLAPSRSGGNSPVRIDVAFPLSQQSGRTRWSLSVQAGQAF